jgi:hypothetical protein
MRALHGNITSEGPKLYREGYRYKRIISPTPCVPGRWPSIPDAAALEQTIYATMDLANNILSPDGTITTNVGRGTGFHGQQELKRWMALNPDRLEEVPNSAFRVYYGVWRDLNNNDVFVFNRPDNHHYKTFRRVGSIASDMNEYTLPSDVHQETVNKVYKAGGCYPLDHHPTPNEGEAWLLARGYDYNLKRNNPNFKKMKATFVEYDHAPGVYIQIPLQPMRYNFPCFGLPVNIIEHISDPTCKGTSHARRRKEKYATWDMWLYFWMMKVYTNPGEKVILPFAQDGDITVAALMAGLDPVTIEANDKRHSIQKDIMLEWSRAISYS